MSERQQELQAAVARVAELGSAGHWGALRFAIANARPKELAQMVRLCAKEERRRIFHALRLGIEVAERQAAGELTGGLVAALAGEDLRAGRPVVYEVNRVAIPAPDQESPAPPSPLGPVSLPRTRALLAREGGSLMIHFAPERRALAVTYVVRGCSTQVTWHLDQRAITDAAYDLLDAEAVRLIDATVREREQEKAGVRATSVAPPAAT